MNDLEKAEKGLMIASSNNIVLEEESLPNHAPKLVLSASEPQKQSERMAIPIMKRVATEPNFASTSEKSRTHLEWANLNIFANSLPPLKIPVLRRRSTSVPVFYCQICIENHSIEESFQVSSCFIGHKFCNSSMSGYLSSQINDGMVSLRCPCFGEGCNGEFSEMEVQNLVDKETFQKYLRFRSIKNNPDYRECPKCASSVIGNPDSPEITCEACGEVYCFFHANAHPNVSCSDYSREQAKVDMKSAALIRRVARKCPQCHADTEKNGGCNHMTCQHCGENWCWICGRHMDDNHYEDVLGGCAGQQFTEPSRFALWTICPCVRSPVMGRVIRIPYYLLLLTICLPLIAVLILCGVICGAFCLAMAPFAGCFFLFDTLKNGSSDVVYFMFPGYVLAAFFIALLMFILSIMWLPFGAIIFALQLPLRFCGCVSSGDVSHFSDLCDCSEDEGNAMHIWLLPLALVGSLLSGMNDD